MKASRFSCALIGAAFLCSIPAFAGNSVRKSLHISDTVHVHGVMLSPGDYKVEWDTPGPNVQLRILHGHDTVATVPAHVVPEPISNAQDGYAVKEDKAGTGEMLTEVFFSGENYHLDVSNSASSSAKGTSSSGT